MFEQDAPRKQRYGIKNEDQIIVFRNNQRYDQIGTEPDVRRDGTKTKLLIFESACAVCEHAFMDKTTKRQLATRCVLIGDVIGA
jgi:hypothetical protein